MGKILSYPANTSPDLTFSFIGADPNAPTVTQIVSVATLTGIVFPSGDTTGATDSAALSTLIATGRTVQMVNGSTYYAKAPVQLETGTVLYGGGATISPGSAWTSGNGLLELASTSTTNTIIRDLTLKDDYTVTSLYGVYYEAGGAPSNYLYGVTAEGFNEAGFFFGASSGSSAAHCVSCIASANLGDGFLIEVDTSLTDCVAGSNMGHGFHCNTSSSNDRLTGCVAVYNGYDPKTAAWPTSGTSCGFFADDSSQYIQFTGCSAQQNGLHGFALGATSGSSGYSYQCTVTGCEADTNSCYSSGTGYGIFASSPQGLTVTGCSGGNNTSLSPGSQGAGLYIDGTADYASCTFFSNTVEGSSANVPPIGAWNTFVLDSGWTVSSGHAAPAYRLNSDGALVMTGSATHASFTTATALNSSNELPAEYQPANYQYIPGDANTAGCEYNTSGEIIAEPMGSGSTTLCLDGKVFWPGK